MVIDEIILRQILRDDGPRRSHSFTVGGCGARAQYAGGGRAAVEFQPGETDPSRSPRISGGNTVGEGAVELPGRSDRLLSLSRVLGRRRPIQFFFNPKRNQSRCFGENRLPVLLCDCVQQSARWDLASCVQPGQRADGEFRVSIRIGPSGLDIVPLKRLEISQEKRQPVGRRLGQPGGLLGWRSCNRCGEYERGCQSREQHSQSGNFVPPAPPELKVRLG